MGSHKILNYTFGETTKEPWNFAVAKMDGICGMAFPAISVGNKPPVFTSLIE